ncbi:hypothetical protein IW262DRAFT_1454835 [Armillaria fumosa]|nr:hypothetical protein IW262DRAFT_1454835 [Armillaria fumosa]
MSRILLVVLSILIRYAIASPDNITIDDTDGRIVYEGTWNDRSIYNSTLDFGGSHSLSEDRSAAAIFTFTNNGPSTIINLTDTSATSVGNGSETVMWNVRWSRTGLSNTSHTLRMSIVPSRQYIVVDAIMYTVDEPSTSILTSSSITASSSSSSSTSSSSNTHTSSANPVPTPEGTRSNTLAIVLGVALGAITLLAAIGLSIFCLRYEQGNPRASYQSSPFRCPSPSLSSKSTAFDTNTERGLRPLTCHTNTSAPVPHGRVYPSRISDVSTIHDPHNHADNCPLLEFEMMPESGHLEEWEAVEVGEEDWEDLCVGKGKKKMSYANALKGKPEG